MSTERAVAGLAADAGVRPRLQPFRLGFVALGASLPSRVHDPLRAVVGEGARTEVPQLPESHGNEGPPGDEEGDHAQNEEARHSEQVRPMARTSTHVRHPPFRTIRPNLVRMVTAALSQTPHSR